jgi:dolichol-phosphate mannosyltransferase
LAVKIEKEYGAHFIPIAKTTEGAACTILFAHKFINNDSPLLLANSDQIVDVPMGDFIGDCRKRNLDGSILTFQSDHPKWSYADVDPKTHLVTRVKEKEVISRFATVGVYYFEKGKTFVEGALDMIINNDRFNKEFYTCPAYNYSIRSGAKIGVYDIPVSAMHGCGTPEDLHGYLDFVKRAPSPPLRMSVVVPTFNESQNVPELLHRLEATLGATRWEVVFVDDDSPDGTAALVRRIALADSRVRCLQRIGRRGLSSACIEGMLAASAPIIAVMDADLQHDEAVLPKMLQEIEQHGADVAIATRYALGGSAGSWNESRKAMSRLATAASRAILTQPVSDPMSGFFMMRREVLETTSRKLSGLGFKILLDILATAKDKSIRIAEVPYRFRDRFAGESKLDEMVIWEYGMLLADKTIGRFVPVRFLTFSLIGGLGVVVHMAVLTLVLKGLAFEFTMAQSVATATAMIFNFALNNVLTYRDRRLRGWEWLKGLVTFMAACSVGAVANVGIATYLYGNRTQWVFAALAGVLVGAVWNYAVTQLYTWGKAGRH